MRQWQLLHKRVEPELGFALGLILGGVVMTLFGPLWAGVLIAVISIIAGVVAWRSRVIPVEKVDHCLDLVDWPRLMERLSEGEDPLWPWVSPEGSAGSDFNKAVNKIRRQREELLEEISHLTKQVESLKIELVPEAKTDRRLQEISPR